MEKEIAKAFVLNKVHDCNKIYVSKDLQKLMDLNDGELPFIFAVVETDSGDTICNMDWSYAEEPIIMGRFIHKDYFFKHFGSAEIVDLDK